MNNIDYHALKRSESILKNIDIHKYVDYTNISNTNWNDSFINNYIKDIQSEKYDKIFEKSIKLSSISYLETKYIEDKLKDIRVICSNDIDKSSYYIIYNKEHNNIIITFRGTSYFSEVIKGLEYYRTKFDFISDEEKDLFIKWRNKNIYKNKYFDKEKVPLKDDIDIEIHKGYYNVSLHMLYPLINQLLQIIKNQKTNIVFLGHSMGIISNIISLLLKIKLSKYILLKDKLINIKMYNITINSPTIGNKNYNLLKFYYGIDKTIQFYNYQDKFISYGYHDTIFNKKKIRHTEYMLKGIYAEINKKSYININYGENIDEIFKTLKENGKIVNELKFFHLLFKIPGYKKMLLI
jgi:hypothetical protein